MMFKTIIGTVLALGLTTFEASGAFSIVSLTDTQTSNNGSSNIASNADDMADFLAVVSDVMADNSDDHSFSDADSHHERYVGLGFALNGECMGNQNLGNGHRDCGEPSPSD